MIWVALAIVVIGILIYQELQRHNRLSEELKQKELEEELKLEQEKLKANPKYTKLKSLQVEISGNRRTYAINERYKLETQIKILNSKEDEKVKKLKSELKEIDKNQSYLQKEYRQLMKKLKQNYGDSGPAFQGIDWPEDIFEENRDLQIQLWKIRDGKKIQKNT